VPDELIDAVMNSADAGGVELLGEGGVIAELTKRILERGLNEELSAHLGYGAGDQGGRESGNNRNGTSAKTVLTEIGAVELDIPRDRNGFALGEHHDAALAKAALCMAAAVRGGDVRGVVFHSDKAVSTPATSSLLRAPRWAWSSRWAGSARHWTTRQPKASTRPSSSSCCRAGALPARMPPAGRSPGYIDRYNHHRRHSSAGMLAPVAYEAVLAARATEADQRGEAA